MANHTTKQKPYKGFNFVLCDTVRQGTLVYCSDELVCDKLRSWMSDVLETMRRIAKLEPTRMSCGNLPTVLA